MDEKEDTREDQGETLNLSSPTLFEGSFLISQYLCVFVERYGKPSCE